MLDLNSQPAAAELKMASSDVLSKTLDSITATKLNEISKQRSIYESAKAEVLARLQREHVPRERVRILLDGVEKLKLIERSVGPSHSVSNDNIRRFLEQSRHDPSVSLQQQQSWESTLLHEFDVQSLRFEYASLYAGLVTEWLSNSNEGLTTSEANGFEKVGRKEMHEQRVIWESYVFKASDTNAATLKTFLDKLFTSTKPVKKALQSLRDSISIFEKEFTDNISFDESTLKWCIKGLLGSDLLTDSKRTVLLDFANNKIVLRELADVLNMRMNALDSWKWGEEGTPVEQRRQLNGKYRFFHDEDLLQTIFLRYIGVRWSVLLKRALKTFIATDGVWKSSNPITKADQQRREHFLDSSYTAVVGVEEKHKRLWDEDVFLEQLQSKVEERNRAYDDSDDDSDDGQLEDRKSPLQVVQAVLHLLTSDIIIKTRLGEDLTVLRSDFEWFGPSLPHSSMLAVLRYFGVSSRWTNFFQRVLECPIRMINDGQDSPIQVRKRGTPPSMPVSDFLGEALLFCLDFGVNQWTNGGLLFRLHDDLWFWGSEKMCETGWACITEFCKATGLKLNTEKTGCVKITRKGDKPASISSALPKGDIRWGFLKLDAVSGQFLIDQKMVDNHIAELRLQLDACKSVFDWIQVWNIYAVRFFTNNFGRPAGCSGTAYVDMILETFARIQSELFRNTNAKSVTEVVKDMITTRFGVQNIPEGFLYFPLAQGGLDLRSPFIGPYLVRDSLLDRPDYFMDRFFEDEESAYLYQKQRYENPDTRSRKKFINIAHDEKFMSFQEFTRYRERNSPQLVRAFDALMEEPDETSANLTADVSAVVKSGNFGTKRGWNDLSAYDKWLYQLYGADMISRFNGLNVMEKGLLPIGMVNMFRRSRFQWVQ